MTGLCGWLDLPAAPTVAAAMAERLPTGSGDCVQIGQQPAAGLALKSPDTARCWAESDGLWCAITGDFRWTDAALAQLATERGHGFALAEAYRSRGSDSLRDLRGRFALAVLEPARGAALLAIDRVGTERLVYRAGGAGLLFGSTIDAVRAHPGFAPELSPQAIFDYLHLSVIPGPDSVYRDTRKLLPGEYLRYEQGRAVVGSYWEPPEEAARSAPEEELAQAMRDRLQKAVDAALAGQDGRQVGTFLSGGLDSSTVLGLATRRLGAPVKCFTIGFDTEEFDESSYADIAARYYHAEHHSYSVTAADAANMLEQLALTYDEPFGNSSAVPTFHCARLAREHGISLMLAGDGGDEIFAGNERYVQQEVFEIYSRLPAAVRRLLEPALLCAPGGDRIPGFRKLRSYIRRARVPMPDRMNTYNFLSGPRLAEVFEPDFLAKVDPDGPMQALRRVYGRAHQGSMLRRMLQFDMQVTLADNDLRKVTAMCELAGMDVRFPFLDEEVVEFGATLPSRLLIRGFRLRDFYKRAMRDILPPEVIAKRKHGFGMPIRHWFASDTPVRPAVADALASLKNRGIVRPAFLNRLIDDRAGQIAGEYGQLAWYLAVLERWLAARSA